MNILAWFLGLFSIWWVWLPIVLILLYLTFQNNRRIRHIDTVEHVILKLEVPTDSDKRADVAEQLFASLHNILRTKKELVAAGELQEHLAFELVATQRLLHFYIRVPKHLQNYVESQFYTQYPNIQMRTVEDDYAARQLEGQVFYAAELGLKDNQALPLKTYESFEADPLQGLASVLGKLESPNEQYWIQILARPTDFRWQRRSEIYAKRLKSGNQLELAGLVGMLGTFVKAFWQAPSGGSGGGGVELSDRDRKRVEAAEQKAKKPGYQVKIRVAYVGESESVAKMRVNTALHAFKQFNAPDLNGLVQKRFLSGTDGHTAYKTRFFIDRGFVLDSSELGTLYHLPHSQMSDTNIAWAKAKPIEPPNELPTLTGDFVQDSTISAIATTSFRGISQQFGTYRSDRDRHVYIIGQTGVGKSKLLELFALSDLYHNQGYAIIDPHGDFAVNNLYFVPPGRMKDVVYFNPADTAHPIGFNPMELSDPAFKGRVSTELVNVVKPLFGNTWNTRLEYMLRYIMLALLETPGTTMCDITRMLTDQGYREMIVSRVVDPVVRAFWTDEFANWQRTYEADTVSPILNKIGAFTGNPIIRNIVGQPKSTFNLRQIMDEGKIFVASTSGALLGEESAALLGSLLITKIQQAAMSRTDPQTRRPFYLYVDEFQNFATDSFVPILSEARKYGLSLTMANQYIGQMSPVVRDAVFGNVGTMIVFRISPDDANSLSSFFGPRFEPKDLSELHNRNFAVAMTIQGEKTVPFSGTTLALPTPQQNYLAEIINSTRAQYTRPQAEVEAMLLQAAQPVPINTPAQPSASTMQPAQSTITPQSFQTPQPSPESFSQPPFISSPETSGPEPNPQFAEPNTQPIEPPASASPIITPDAASVESAQQAPTTAQPSRVGKAKDNLKPLPAVQGSPELHKKEPTHHEQVFRIRR